MRLEQALGFKLILATALVCLGIWVWFGIWP